MRHIVICCLLMSSSACAEAQDLGPAMLCRGAIASAESNLHIPDAFLSAIARVESGRAEDQGMRMAWPWTINALGQGHFFATKQEAINAVNALHASGVTSIDVGCLQVNLAQHPQAFGSLDQAFDPNANVNYGAQFLRQLFGEMGSWPRAAAAYHSRTPTEGHAYLEKVLDEWSVPQDRPDKQATAEAKMPHSVPFTHTAALSVAAAAATATATQAAPQAVPQQTASLTPQQSASLFNPAAPSAGYAATGGAFGHVSTVQVNNMDTSHAPPRAMGRDLASYRRMPVNVVRPLQMPSMMLPARKQG